MQILSDAILKQIDEQFCISVEKEIFVEQGNSIPFFHDSYVLLLLADGNLLIDIEHNEQPLAKEHGLLLPMQTSYTITASKDSHICMITFSGAIAQMILSETIQQGNFIDSPTFFLLERGINHLQTLDSSDKEYRSISFSLLLQLYKNTKPFVTPLYPPLVLSAIRLMEENFTYLYGIEELAEQLEVSKNHLIRQFHDAVGISPGRYLTNVKINYAKEMLLNGETSLELIAITCGFSGASYFRKVFKKETGFSPSEFRSQATLAFGSKLPDEFYL